MRAGITVVAVLLSCQVAVAQNFSVSDLTFDTGGGLPPPDDILLPGPAPILPGTPGLIIDVDAFSYGRTGPIGSTYNFSVDFTSVGTAGSALFAEASAPGGLGDQNVDVFRTDILTMAGTNVQVHDGDGLPPGGTVSPLGLLEPAAPFGLNPLGPGVDGYDTRLGPGSSPFIYWSYDPFVAASSGIFPSGSAADVLISPTIPGYTSALGIYATSFALGLGGGPDNIDALEIYDGGVIGTYDLGDVVLFSLDPFSTSLFGLGATPGDVLSVTFGGAPSVFVTEGTLGLASGDNLTALSVIPEPSSFAFLAIAALGLVRRKR